MQQTLVQKLVQQTLVQKLVQKLVQQSLVQKKLVQKLVQKLAGKNYKPSKLESNHLRAYYTDCAPSKRLQALLSQMQVLHLVLHIFLSPPPLMLPVRRGISLTL